MTVLAVDHAAVGFNIGRGAMNELTGGRAVEVGNVDVQWTEVGRHVCGL